MNNYCSFSQNQESLKWMDYILTRQEFEEADELCHGNWIEIQNLQERIIVLEKLLQESAKEITDKIY